MRDRFENFFDIDGSGDLDFMEKSMMQFHIRELYEKEERKADAEEDVDDFFEDEDEW